MRKLRYDGTEFTYLDSETSFGKYIKFYYEAFNM
jgi:hypothetical protein